MLYVVILLLVIGETMMMDTRSTCCTCFPSSLLSAAKTVGIAWKEIGSNLSLFRCNLHNQCCEDDWWKEAGIEDGSTIGVCGESMGSLWGVYWGLLGTRLEHK